MRKVYWILCILITLGIACVGAFWLQISYVRLWESIKDFGLSIAYWLCEQFDIDHAIEPMVIYKSSLFESEHLLPGTPSLVILPEDWNGFGESVALFFRLFFSGKSFKRWIIELMLWLSTFFEVISLGGMILLAVYFLIRQIYEMPNRRRKDSFPLRAFKLVSKYTYQPCKRFVLGFVDFVREFSHFRNLWLFIMVMNLNVVTIGIEAVAFYFYFLVEFDFIALWTQIVKLFQDLWVIFYNFPWWSVGIVAWLFFDKWRRNIAENKLAHMDAMNCGFIKALPVANLCCGDMGKGKTLTMTSMVRYAERIQRQDACEILLEEDYKFPNFPWIRLEDEFKFWVGKHKIYNLATAERWIEAKQSFCADPARRERELYGYDYERYGMTFDTGIKSVTLFDSLKTYAKAYFAYTQGGSLIVSNYSIRSDCRQIDNGNFPMWYFGTLHQARAPAQHSHVIDYDAFRLGNKFDFDNPRIGSFEFGVLAITEIGKERGNNLENQEMKKLDVECNAKNDLFNSWLKMSRHSAMIGNRPFVKVFADEQRPESWGADARDVAAVLHIRDMGEGQLAMPFFTVEEMIQEWLYGIFRGMYTRFRNKRGDTTLLIHALKNIFVFFWKRGTRIYNKYGYKVVALDKEDGKLSGKKQLHPYYIVYRQVYDTFSTDCFSDYFRDLALKTSVGLADWPEYAADRASKDELLSQNSYFMNDIYRGERE